MVRIIGVNFRNGGKIYYFSPGDRPIKVGEKVIVETNRGVELGSVILGTREVDEEKIKQPLTEVIRMATEEDIRRVQDNRVKEREAYVICQEKIRKHGLEMKLISCEYAFENNKILFYFTADGRIDFRELVKDLASVFRTRIELRQVGVRDETKMLGGIGICGRELCCKSYLSDFVPVSIRMAKEQNLSLNPTKISGTCGRLMCCLKNEEETYEYLNSRLPAVGEFVLNNVDNTNGKVYSVDVLRQKVKVVVSLPGDDLEIREYPVEQLRFKPRRRNTEEDLELTDEQLALEEELSKVKAEHAEAAAAAAAAAVLQQKTQPEKNEPVSRKENTAYQQAIKTLKENDAAEKAEREERKLHQLHDNFTSETGLAASMGNQPKTGIYTTSESSVGDIGSRDSSYRGDRARRNQQPYARQNSGSVTHDSHGVPQDRQRYGRYHEYDRDGQEGREERDGIRQYREYQNKEYQNRGSQNRDSQNRNYQSRDYQSRDYQNRDYQNRDYQNRDYQNRDSYAQGETHYQRRNYKDRTAYNDDGPQQNDFRYQRNDGYHGRNYEGKNKNYRNNYSSNNTSNVGGGNASGGGDKRFSDNREPWRRSSRDSYHSQKRRSGYRYSSRKNNYNQSYDREDDE